MKPTITFQLHLEDFLDELFHELERVQDGKRGHTVEFYMEQSLLHSDAQHKEICAERIAKLVTPFIAKKLRVKHPEYDEDDE